MDFNFLEISSILSIPPHLREMNHIENLLDLTKNVHFFQRLSAEQESTEMHQQCCQRMLLETHEKNNILFHFGDKGDKFYIILKGSVSVKIPSNKKITLSKENLNKFQNLLAPDVKNMNESHEINNIAEQKSENNVVIKISDMLNKLTDISYKNEEEDNEMQHILTTEAKNLMKMFKKSLNKEKKILLGVIKNPDGKKVEVEIDEFNEIGVLTNGDSFGELSLISDAPRAATIQVLENSAFLVLNKQDFKKILGKLAEKRLAVIALFMSKLPYFNE